MNGLRRAFKVMAAVTLLGLMAMYTLTGCNTSGCTDNQNAIPLAGFYAAETEAAVAFNVLDIGGVGAPNDSLLLASGSSASQIYLPFRSDMPSTSFYIHYDQEGIDYVQLNDTITFAYTSTSWLTSEECGVTFRYHIDRVEWTTHIVDSVGIVDSLITNIDRETIRIFFRTQTADDEEDEEASAA